MAITESQTQHQVRNYVVGRHLDDASSPAAIDVDCGFVPRYVQVVNLTDRITFEFYEGMTDTNALKTVANGTRTLETSGGITLTTDGFSLDAAAVIQNKQYSWVAIG